MALVGLYSRILCEAVDELDKTTSIGAFGGEVNGITTSQIDKCISGTKT